jgi:hypothetical protein
MVACAMLTHMMMQDYGEGGTMHAVQERTSNLLGSGAASTMHPHSHELLEPDAPVMVAILDRP